MKKQLVATCSHDNTIRIWNYHTKTLEICEVFLDEPMSLAFHPSGYHLVVGFIDRVRIMNVYSHNIRAFSEINIKACKEIKFSNGGHLFACANNSPDTNEIKIYRFYSGDCPQEYIFKHNARVKTIQWMEDDNGFISVSMDGSILQWRLNTDSLALIGDKRGSFSNPEFKIDFKGGVKVTDVAIRADVKNTVIAITED